MFLRSLVVFLVACGGTETTPTAEPKPGPTAPGPEAPKPAEPAEPAAPLPALEVALEDNQKTCFGDADCVPVELDCCCGGTVVAANKGSADAVKKKFTRPTEQCKDTTCEEACPESKAKCVEFKCAMAE